MQRLFDAHTGLADRLARRYSFGAGLDEDLRQVAQIGLLLACRRFDPELGVFGRFATVTILGELKKHFRSSGWGVRVPRRLQEDSITVAAARERLSTRLGHEPTVAEVADHTGFDRERVVEAVRAHEARFTKSIEHAGIDVAHPHDVEESALLAHAMSSLDTDDRELIRLRFRDGLTQSEIGRLLGVSQPQVHRRIEVALARLRTTLGEHPPAD